MYKKILINTLLFMSLYLTVFAQSENNSANQPKKNLYVVSTAHLDTQWRWTIQQTINDYIPATLHDNFKLLETFPDYVFSFEGAFHYMLMKEYYPEEYKQLKKYITDNRWRVTGSWVNAVDVNLPSPESLIRQALYGNGFFKNEFDKTSYDVYLPDCFGFGFALPSIASHCGLRSFSTQKLSWGSAYGLPFDIGIWEGVDGSSLVSAINPGAYVSQLKDDLSRDTLWLRLIDQQGAKSGLYAAYKYIGTGDVGGAPDSLTVAWLEKSMKSDGPITVKNIGADDLSGLITDEEKANLPRYKGELVMTRHGVGCYTSQTAMKRWNRKNELLANAAERASVIADLLGGATYPRKTFKDAWTRFLWHQFHDDLTGTSIPEAYVFSWNDELLSLNNFSSTLENAVEVAASAMDTRVKGIPLVVYNPLSIARQDVVEATVNFDGPAPKFWSDESYSTHTSELIDSKGPFPKHIRVYDSKGEEVLSQVTTTYNDSIKILFLATVPPVGYAVYDVRTSEKPCALPYELKIEADNMENQRYRVRLDNYGDVISIFDKTENRELLKRPIRLELLNDEPKNWAAWEIDYDDIMAEPKIVPDSKADIKIIEHGPVRVSFEVIQKYGHSTFNQRISLSAGQAGDRVEFASLIDWYERETLLKATFRLTSANENVTYDLGLGNIDRGINKPELYEVPGHQWAVMTSPEDNYSVAVLNDCKYGWDHPDRETLRLTLIHTPGVNEKWSWINDQRSQDNGRHHILYAVQGHRGGWHDGAVQWSATRLNQPLLAFQTKPHKGKLGKEYSLLTLNVHQGNNNPQIAVNAVKYAENSDEIIIRLQELFGKTADNVQVSFTKPIISAREVNGVEEPLGEASVKDGILTTSFTPFQPRTFALTLHNDDKKMLTLPESKTITLPYNLDGISLDNDRQNGDFDGEGNTLSGDILPDTLFYQDISFIFGDKTAEVMNVLSCKGQNITLPTGDYNRLYLLAASTGGMSKGLFTIGNTKYVLWIPDYTDPIGQWNNRMVSDIFNDEPVKIAPAYINRAPIAWTGTHRHDINGKNEAYIFTNLFPVMLEIPTKTNSLILPDNPQIKILAATLVKDNTVDVHPCQPLYDVADGAITSILSERRSFIDSINVRIACPVPGAEIRYTLDGNTPDRNSIPYIQPFTLNKTTIVKACAFLGTSDKNFVSDASFQQLVPRDPIVMDSVVSGLECSYYEGEWTKLPNFDSLPVNNQIVMSSVSIPEIAREENFGLVFTGFIKITVEGMYDFYTNSDDGSVLYIDNTLLVDNDGLHGDTEVGSEIALKPGLHSIKILMFQATGGRILGVSFRGPDFLKRNLSADMLFRALK